MPGARQLQCGIGSQKPREKIRKASLLGPQLLVVVHPPLCALVESRLLLVLHSDPLESSHFDEPEMRSAAPALLLYVTPTQPLKTASLVGVSNSDTLVVCDPNGNVPVLPEPTSLLLIASGIAFLARNLQKA